MTCQSSLSAPGEDAPMRDPEAPKAPRVAPTPRGVPFFGNLFETWRDPLDFFVRSHRAHGDVVRLLFGPYRYYLLNDPAHVHHVLVDNHKNYAKSRNYRGLKAVVGQGLITSEGELWRRQRKLAQPAFHRQRLGGFVRLMARDTGSMLARWATLESREIDVHEEMLRLTLRIVARTLFSTDVEQDAPAIGAALTLALRWANTFVESVLPTPVWVPTPENLRFKRAKKTLDELVLRIIEDRRQTAGRHEDLLAMLMDARDEEAQAVMSDVQLKDEVMTIVLAGHETTANALSWAFYLLSRHPAVARRVHAEVCEVLGERAPTLADLPRLAYTKQVIEEALRLYPPVWVFERQALEKDTIGEFGIERGALVGISPWSIHRSTKLWDNPEGFDPERFRPETSAARPKYAYLPFGGGPRLCIGNGFAIMEAQVILAMVMQRHALELVPGHPVIPEPLVTLRPQYGIRMRLSGAWTG
jgi:cytochrome P450